MEKTRLYQKNLPVWERAVRAMMGLRMMIGGVVGLHAGVPGYALAGMGGVWRVPPVVEAETISSVGRAGAAGLAFAGVYRSPEALNPAMISSITACTGWIRLTLPTPILA